MKYELVRTNIVIYSHVFLIIILASIILLSTWPNTKYYDILYSRTTMLNYIFVLILMLGILRMLWDIYMIVWKVPLIKINEDLIFIRSVFFKYKVFPLSKIEELKLSGNKYFFNVSLEIKKTPFINYSKCIYAINFTEKAEKYLIQKGVKLTKTNEKIIYFNKE